MIKCPECGMLEHNNQLSCSNCGYPFDGTEEQVDVKICPNCGEPVDQNLSICSCCGYDFSGESKTEEDIQLLNRLKNAEEKARQAELRALEYQAKLDEEKRRNEIKERQKEEARRIKEIRDRERQEDTKKKIDLAEQRAIEAEKRVKEAETQFREQIFEKERIEKHNKLPQDHLLEETEDAPSPQTISESTLGREDSQENNQKKDVSGDDLFTVRNNKDKGITGLEESGFRIENETIIKEDVKKNKGFYAKASMVFLGIICIVGILFAITHLSKSESNWGMRELPWTGYIDADGTAYIPTSKGMISIKGEAKEVKCTHDHKHIVILDKDGTLTSYDSNGKDKHDIGSNITEILNIQNDGVLYSKMSTREITVEDILKAVVNDYKGFTNYATVKSSFDENFPNGNIEDAKTFYYYITNEFFDKDTAEAQDVGRFMFDNNEIIEIGIVDDYKTNGSNTNLLYRIGAKLYVLKNNSKEAVQIAVCKKEKTIELLAINASGNVAVWGENEGGTKEIYANDNNKKERLGEVNIENSLFDLSLVDYINGGDDIFFNHLNSDSIIYKKEGNEAVEFKVGQTIISNIYTKDGPFVQDENIYSEDFYIVAYSEEKSSESKYHDSNKENLYHVSKSQQEKLLSDVDAVLGVYGGVVYYIKDGDDLYRAKLGEKQVSEETKIAAGVRDIKVSSDFKQIFYERNYDEESNTFSLYSCNSKNGKDSTKIAANVYKYFISPDGKKAALICDPEVINDTLQTGDLYFWDGKSELEKISDDVLDVKTTYSGSFINKDFLYLKLTDSQDLSYELYKKGFDDVLAENLVYSIK